MPIQPQLENLVSINSKFLKTMKVSKSAADALFTFNTPTGKMDSVKDNNSNNPQDTFNDFQCVPESKAADQAAASTSLQFY